MRSGRTRIPSCVPLVLACLAASQADALAGEIQSSFSPEVILAGKIFNVLVLVAGLGYILRKPIRNFFHDRTEEIRRKLDEAEKPRHEAVGKLQLLEERLQQLDEETAAIRRQAAADAEAERQRILRGAEEEAERLRVKSQNEIEAMKKQAITELRQFTADRAADMAADILRREIRPEDEERLFAKFMENMGAKR
jgi:F-type H+-transporting ATPase subunit b